jgi:hypothetical protein
MQGTQWTKAVYRIHRKLSDVSNADSRSSNQERKEKKLFSSALAASPKAQSSLTPNGKKYFCHAPGTSAKEEKKRVLGWAVKEGLIALSVRPARD